MLTSPQCEREVPEHRTCGRLHGNSRERVTQVRFPESQVLPVHRPEPPGVCLQSSLTRNGEEDKDLAGLMPVPGQVRVLNSEAERCVRGLNGLLRRSQVGPDDEVKLAYLRFHASILKADYGYVKSG